MGVKKTTLESIARVRDMTDQELGRTAQGLILMLMRGEANLVTAQLAMSVVMHEADHRRQMDTFTTIAYTEA